MFEHAFLNPMNSSTQRIDLALLALRLTAGAVFVYHGAQKLFGAFGGYGIEGTAGWMESIGIPFPVLSASLAGGAEFFGGLALIVGLGARLLSIPLTFTMLVAIATTGGVFDNTAGGFEYPLVLAVLVASIGLVGPGRYALRFSKSEAPAAAVASAQ